MNKKIYCLILYLTLIYNFASTQTIDKKRFIHSIVDNIDIENRTSFFIKLKIKCRNNKIETVITTNSILFHTLKEYDKYTLVEYTNLIKKILLNDGVLDLNKHFKYICDINDTDACKKFEDGHILKLKKENLNIIDSIIKNNKNWINVLFLKNNILNSKYGYLHDELIYKLWDLNIALRSCYDKDIKYMLGYYNKKIVNKELIDNVKLPYFDPMKSIVILKELNIWCFIFEENTPMQWKINETSYIFSPHRIDYKGSMSFKFEKNNRPFITGEYKSDGIWHEEENTYKGLINLDSNSCMKNYYLPHKVGKWKYYDDKGNFIREVDYGN